MPAKTNESVVESLLDSLGPDLVDDEQVSGELAITNAHSWGMDTYEVVDAVRDGDSIKFTAIVCLSGEQSGDHPFNGDQLEVTLEGVAMLEDDVWELESYTVTKMKSNVDDD